MKPEEILNKKVMTRALEKIGAFIRDEAKRRCPVDDGILRNSMQYRLEGDNSVVIFSDLNYAPYVEYGTGRFHVDEEGNPQPHQEWDIYPVNGQALRFEVGRKERLAAHQGPAGANIVFAKKVHIRGMNPQPFLRPAFHQNIQTIKQIIKNEIEAH